MLAFTWNGGGTVSGKPWSAEAPTDSALLLYLFAAFLAAPHWDFPKVLCWAGNVSAFPDRAREQTAVAALQPPSECARQQARHCSCQLLSPDL